MKTFELEINKSKFIAYKLDLSSLEEVKPFLEQLRKDHKKARHVCYAYVFNKETINEKCNDDGEPQGTAGIPTLEVIKKEDLRDVVVVVTRYFGGIKLGAGGLTRAYTKACAGVLSD